MTDNYRDSDYVTALDALVVTLGNLKVDNASILSDGEWDEVLTITGEDMYRAGRDGEWRAARALFGMMTSMFTFEDVPPSLRERFRLLSHELNRV